MINISNTKLIASYYEKNNIPLLFSSWDKLSITLVHYNKGELIYALGSSVNKLLFVVEGSIKLSTINNLGELHHITYYNDYALLGDIEYILDCPAISQVEAITEVYCIVIPLSKNKIFIDEDIIFHRYLNKLEALKLTKVNDLEIHKETYHLELRLANYLLLHQTVMDDNIMNIKKISLELHCSYRQLLRIYKKFCSDGILIHGTSRGHYHIKDLSALEKLALRVNSNTEN